MDGEATFGKYRLLAELGRGGMADVFLAMVVGPEGSGFSKLGVIKRLRQNLAEDPDFVSMLLDEARISARLSHPNVVQLHEVGTAGESYYLAMEFLDGQPLHRVQLRVRTAGAAFPSGAELLIVSDVLAGLHHAHELADYDGTPLHVVHRDVNPQNIFVTYGGHIKVMDFGIAKAAGRSSETRQGIVKGKIRYMAPEQATGAAIDRRADVFAAGLLLWEAVVGKRFWGQMEEAEIATALVSGAYNTHLRSVKADASEELERICAKALAHAPDARYPTADAFKVDLDLCIARQERASLRGELGRLAARLFEKERGQMKAVVEEAARGAQPLSMELLNSSRSSTSRSLRPIVADGEVAAAPALAEPSPPAPRSPSRAARVGLAAVLAGTVVAISVTLATRGTLAVDGVGSLSPEARQKAFATHVAGAELPEVLADDLASPAAVQIIALQAPARWSAQQPPPPVARPVALAAAPAPAARVTAVPATPSSAPGDMQHRAHRPKAALDPIDPWKDLPAPPPPPNRTW